MHPVETVLNQLEWNIFNLDYYVLSYYLAFI